jgi:hypothetical protein
MPSHFGPQAVCGASMSDIDHERDDDCDTARDRWLTAEVARLQAVVEAVRRECEPEPLAYDGRWHCDSARNALRAEIAALLPPKESP